MILDTRDVYNLTRQRYDYFLIWGNGLSYKRDIFEILRKEESFKIVRIENHQPKSISKFVRKVYSYDYAPFQHLKSKTEYLLKTEPDIVVIFLLNKRPMEVYRGKGAFRHIECERIKQVKTEIRNKYNPRRYGERTEEHVVHASDNESQTDHMLRLLGIKQGINYLRRSPSEILDIPYYLPECHKFSIIELSASQVFCSLIKGHKGSYRREIVKIDETPHYVCLARTPERYGEYLENFLGGPLKADYSTKKFIEFSREFSYLQKPHSTSYILVKKLQPTQYLILDGVHRASILKSRKVERFPVAVMR